MQYDYHPDYYSINTGAHRKGGIEVTTPTLTHHLAIWLPNKGAKDTAKKTKQRFGPMVDKYLLILYKGLQNFEHVETDCRFEINDLPSIVLFADCYTLEKGRQPNRIDIDQYANVSGVLDALESENRIIFFQTSWRQMLTRFRFELHSEFFTVSAFITLPETFSAMNATNVEKSANFLSCLDKHGRKDFDIDCGAKEAYAELYDHVWRELFDDLTEGKGIKDVVQQMGAERGRIFADFRGIIFAGDDDCDSSCLTRRATIKKKGEPFSEDWPSSTLLPSIWPFLTCKEGLDLEKQEFTASFMLRKRAVYITALGPQVRVKGNISCAPLHYILVARPMNNWQLGGLVDRLHYLGALRLAALMELPALRQAGANLRDIEHSSESARKSIDLGDYKSAAEHYRRLKRAISHIGFDGFPIFINGIQFRVERSRYYVKRFRDLLPYLRVDHIEGFQSYPSFVESRLGGTYDYIDRLGRRQERAITSATNIFQDLSLQDSIESSKRATESNMRGVKIAKTIEKIQTKAEIFLLLFILPYYAIGVINYLSDDAHSDKEKTLRRLYIATVVIFMSAALTSLVAFCRDRNLQENANTLLKYFLISITFAVLFIFILNV